MNMNTKYFGIGGLAVKASGRLDLDSAVEYGQTIRDAMDDAADPITELILDFKEVTFISSFGLKVILELYKKLKEANGSLKVANVPEQIFASFKMVGFDKFIEIV